MKFSFLTLFLWLMLFSCTPLRQLNKTQSDHRFKKTENLNFAGEKASTQWWYFDCFFEDGSMLVFLFTPHQWWNANEKITSDQALFYVSYMNANGEVKSASKAFDYNLFTYDENSLTSPYFNMKKSHEKNKRKYTINFDIVDIKGAAVVTSTSKGFSPFPMASMGELATRHILKLKGDGLAFRYASHVPQGKVDCRLVINDKEADLTGKAYHEQGWFNGTPDQMGKGWVWFHFVSKTVNVFGKPGDFLCLEKDGKRLIGGLFKECSIGDKIYADQNKNFLLSGKLNFLSGKRSFEIVPSGKVYTPLISIPSIDTGQLWGTVAQPALIYWHDNKGTMQVEEGWLLLESSKMSKEGNALIE